MVVSRLPVAAVGRWLHSVRPERAHLRADLVAGLPGAISSVPDGMAAAVLAVDDLRGRWGEIAGMRLTRAVLERPTVQAWLDSPNARDFFEARDRILGFLDVTAAEVRDDMLCDAVIFAILVPDEPTLDASQARGLLALKARRPDLLGRLVDRINQAQRESGELAEVSEIRRGAVGYFFFSSS